MADGRQLPLDLGFEPRLRIEDFLVSGSNRQAYDALLRWPNWPERAALLIGPPGSGKTHLARIWADKAEAQVLSAARDTLPEPEMLVRRPTVLDDADRLSEREAWLFHVLNLVRERRSWLLLTAALPPDRWGLATADLLSRLRLSPLLTLDQPGDDLLRAVLVKLFLDRQLVVDTGVIDYLLLRMDRSLDAARRLVEAIDYRSLADGRRITKPVAAEALAVLNPP